MGQNFGLDGELMNDLIYRDLITAVTNLAGLTKEISNPRIVPEDEQARAEDGVVRLKSDIGVSKLAYHEMPNGPEIQNVDITEHDDVFHGIGVEITQYRLKLGPGHELPTLALENTGLATLLVSNSHELELLCEMPVEGGLEEIVEVGPVTRTVVGKQRDFSTSPRRDDDVGYC